MAPASYIAFFHQGLTMHLQLPVLLITIAFIFNVCATLHQEMQNPTIPTYSGISSRLLRSIEDSPLLAIEDRGLPVSSMDKIVSFFSSAKVSDATLKNWLSKGKTADSVFVRLKLDTANEKLFENQQFTSWIKYVDELYAKKPQKGLSTISTLTSYYGNQGLSRMIITAQKSRSTQALATELQARQVKYWLSERTAPADVFKLLILDKAGKNLLENPQFVTWFSYVDDFSKIRAKTKSRISVLTAKYGDKALSKMLVKANKVSTTEKIASKLQAEQIQSWLATQTAPSDVFRFWMLDKAGKNLLDNPQFLSWIKYVDYLNKATPDDKVTVMSVLKTYYTSNDLTTILDEAKQTPGLKNLVNRLKSEQKWMTKDTPAELFKRLKLDKVGDELLSNPQLKTWVSYMKEFNLENAKYQSTLIATLTNNYGDGGLAKILFAARGVKLTSTTAKRLESEQFQRWLRNEWTPDDIFKVLKLDEAGEKLLTDSSLPTWIKYLDLFNQENPTKKTTLLKTLTNNYYSEKRVVQLLEEAQKAAGAKVIASKLQTELYQYWLAANRFPSNVFSMLRLNKADDNLLSDPKFLTWIQYSDDYAVKFPDEEITLLRTLGGYYDDKSLAKMVETALETPRTVATAKRLEGELFKYWFVKNLPPDFIFGSFELNKAGQKLLENPLLSIWSRYLADYNKQNPAKRTSMVETLTKHYSENRLSQMIQEAKKNPATEKIASELGRELTT